MLYLHSADASAAAAAAASPAYDAADSFGDRCSHCIAYIDSANDFGILFDCCSVFKWLFVELWFELLRLPELFACRSLLMYIAASWVDAIDGDGITARCFCFGSVLCGGRCNAGMLEPCVGAAAVFSPPPPPPDGDDVTWFRLCDKFNEFDGALYELGIDGMLVTPAIAAIWLNGWPAMCGGKLGTPGGKPKLRPSGERCEAAWNPDKNRFLCISAAYNWAKWRSRSSRSFSSNSRCSFSRCSFSRCSLSRNSLSRCSLKKYMKTIEQFIKT